MYYFFNGSHCSRLFVSFEWYTTIVACFTSALSALLYNTQYIGLIRVSIAQFQHYSTGNSVMYMKGHVNGCYHFCYYGCYMAPWGYMWWHVRNIHYMHEKWTSQRLACHVDENESISKEIAIAKCSTATFTNITCLLCWNEKQILAAPIALTKKHS